MRGIALSDKIRFLDTTLRDGEQTPGVSLDMEEKLAIARGLDSLGVQVIEAGSAMTSEGERKSIKAVAASGLDAEICSYTRALTSDVDAARIATLTQSICCAGIRPSHRMQAQVGQKFRDT
jgi:D-citramalate synthase